MFLLEWLCSCRRHEVDWDQRTQYQLKTWTMLHMQIYTSYILHWTVLNEKTNTRLFQMLNNLHLPFRQCESMRKVFLFIVYFCELVWCQNWCPKSWCCLAYLVIVWLSWGTAILPFGNVMLYTWQSICVSSSSRQLCWYLEGWW